MPENAILAYKKDCRGQYLKKKIMLMRFELYKTTGLMLEFWGTFF